MKKSLNLIFSLLICSSLFAQNITSDAGMTVPEDRIRTSNEGFASEEFRRGVQAYYKGSFNEAIVQFEKALSFMPNDSLILDWLGKSYYKTGLEGSALSYWQSAQDNGYGGILLANKIEVVRERRVTGDTNENLMRLSEAGSYPGEFNGNLIYSGPISVLPNYDGTFWIAAYNTNNLLLMNQNGSVIDRITGPINGFDRPSDIIRMKDGNILVSESAGNRISLLNQKGHFIKYIGQKGRDLGGLIGPQYLSLDGLSRIYVTDFGNRRVDVFDSEGNPGSKRTATYDSKGRPTKEIWVFYVEGKASKSTVTYTYNKYDLVKKRVSIDASAKKTTYTYKYSNYYKNDKRYPKTIITYENGKKTEKKIVTYKKVYVEPTVKSASIFAI